MSDLKRKGDNMTSPISNKKPLIRATPLPITLLSGFLGSGKTTLLKRILSDKSHGLRIAIIVNDMSTLNIDAMDIEQHTLTSSREKMIKLQNGCICCTLRGDLLSSLVSLSRSGEVEYVIIESTGISEPQQVAETFSVELIKAMFESQVANDASDIDEEGNEMKMSEETLKLLREVEALGGLQRLAKLDTCVTVVDAHNIFHNLNTGEFLTQRWTEEDIPEEDDRTVSDLLIDQIEFADVVLLNKIDMIGEAQKESVLRLVKTLNPTAKVFECCQCVVDVKEVINTGSYDFEKAQTGSGWLKDLHELTLRKINGKVTLAPKPETEEYGISSFVYQARRPFHPKRLFEFVHDKFVLLQKEELYDDDEDNDDQEEDAMHEASDGDLGEDVDTRPESDTNSTSERATSPSSDEDVSDSEHRRMSINSSDTEQCHSHSDGEKMEGALAQKDFSDDVPEATILQNKRDHPLFSKLYRSKGYWWHANRPHQMGEWSQAGSILTVGGGAPWWTCIEKDNWPQDPTFARMVNADFSGEWDDRRQEIVFIGEDLNVAGLTKLLDSCLLNDKEWKVWQTIMRKGLDIDDLEGALAKVFEDGWEDWATTPLLEEVGHAGHHH